MASIATGRPLVPIDAAYPLARQKMILDNAGAATILRESGISLEAELPDLPVIETDIAALAERQESGWPAVPYDPGRMGGVTFTSGSTGTPKGLAWSFGGFMPIVCEMVNTHTSMLTTKIIASGRSLLPGR